MNDHLPGAAAYERQQQRAGGVVVRPLGQASLDASEHLFMMEGLDSKVRWTGLKGNTAKTEDG